MLLSLSPKSLYVFLFHLRIDWINMKEIEWTSISNKNYLFVYLKGIFTLILKMLFLHLHFIFYLVVISLCCVYGARYMQFNWICLNFEWVCVSVSAYVSVYLSIIMENWTKICFYLPKHSHLLDYRKSLLFCLYILSVLCYRLVVILRLVMRPLPHHAPCTVHRFHILLEEYICFFFA